MQTISKKISQSPVIKISLLALGYFVFPICVSGVFTIMSFLAFQHQYFKTTQIASLTARIVLTPVTSIIPQKISPTLHAWKNSLKIIQQSPAFLTVIQQSMDEFTNKSEISFETQTQITKLLDSTCPDLALISTNVSKSYFLQQPSIQENIDVGVKACQFGTEIMSNYQDITGFDKQKNYIVLFQNDQELRPTGGFLGSYALVKFEQGKLTHFEVQDIYVPDGQLPGRVAPPQPIQEAFQQGFWRLRDANWHPDATKSAENISWFFDQSGAVVPDAYVFVNYSSIEKLVELVGEIYLPDYKQFVSHRNLYPFLQNEVEEDFFPGSTQKKDVLSAFSTQFSQKILALNNKQKLSLIKVIFQQLDQKNILLYSKNENLEKYFDEQKWSGNLKSETCLESNCFTDVLSINDANLGVNKMNCCIQRDVEVKKKLHRDTLKIETQVALTYTLPIIPDELKKFGDNYKAFVRIYAPEQATLKSLMINQLSYDAFIVEQKKRMTLTNETSSAPTIDSVQGLREFGFWVHVSENTKTTVEVTLQNDYKDQTNYQLSVIKQPGTKDFYNSWKIQLEDEILFNDTLRSDQMFVGQIK